MFTTLDAKPQEWMEGDASVIHTVTACHFQSLEHAEHWIDRLVPTNRNGEYVKWGGGRRKEKTRREFIQNCVENAESIDFSVSSLSTSEGQMSWFAWAFYMQNRSLVTQRLDAKGRNCLVFSGIGNKELQFPVLRAGYLIWHNHVIRHMAEAKDVTGKYLSDNFCADEAGPGEGKAKGVAFVNFLLRGVVHAPQISLPTDDRRRKCDLISDHLCGWVNSVRTGTTTREDKDELAALERRNPKIENVEFATNLKITDENGFDITAQVKQAVAKGSIDA